MKRKLIGVCFLVLGIFLPCHAHAENWAPTGVEETEYDKDRIFKTKSPDVFVMWFRNHYRHRIGEQRVVGQLFRTEIDCYDKEMRALDAWDVMEGGSHQKIVVSERQSRSFGPWDRFFSSTVCKQSNEFYKRPQPPTDWWNRLRNWWNKLWT